MRELEIRTPCPPILMWISRPDHLFLICPPKDQALETHLPSRMWQIMMNEARLGDRYYGKMNGDCGRCHLKPFTTFESIELPRPTEHNIWS